MSYSQKKKLFKGEFKEISNYKRLKNEDKLKKILKNDFYNETNLRLWEFGIVTFKIIGYNGLIVWFHYLNS